MLTRSIFGAVAASVLSLSPVAGLAQSPDGEPAEFPPESYTANQYIDSEGCAFIRAGISGVTNWVPRVNRERQILCGFQPSLGAPQVAEAEPAPVAETPPPAVAPVVEPPAAPPSAVADAPMPRTPDVGPPIATVAGGTVPPRAAPAPAPAPTPAVVPMPPAAAAPAPPRATVTLAQACEGRSGVQTGYVDAATGAPIDCGPAPRMQVSVPAPAADPTAGLRRVTLVEICAEIAATGARFLDVGTGREIVCAPTPAPVPRVAVTGTHAPMAPAGPVAPAAIAPLAGPGQQPYGCNSRFMRCGPQVQSPSGVTSAIIGARVAPAPTRAFARTPALFELIDPPEVPASNPVGAVAAPVAPPPGYVPVWDDGRVNPARGVPQAVAGPVVAQPVSAYGDAFNRG